MAQFRLEELPANHVLPPQGILQFWMGCDDAMGLTSEDLTQNVHRVMYHEDIDESVLDSDDRSRHSGFPSDASGEPFYQGAGYGLAFERDRQSMTHLDHRFEPAFVTSMREAFPQRAIDGLYELSDGEFDVIDELYGAGGHRLGGYPIFTQIDPRPVMNEELDMLLFQMDSEYEGDREIRWGDMGVAGFFISHEDLARRDFSRTGYTWDCG